MEDLFATDRPRPALGMTSVVLGVIGLMLFFLPVLGLPLSAFGMFFGLLGVPVAIFLQASSLRWSLAGIGTAGLALTVNLAILYAPAGYAPGRDAPQLWRPAFDWPYVPPPAPASW